MNENFMVETEFLFGFQPKDRRYDIVSRILKTYIETKRVSIYYPVSALIEVREVMASHGKSADDRLRALTFIKAKAEASNISEIGFSSENLRLDRLIAIQERMRIPLVSHGSSGILMTPKDAERKGIKLLKGEGTLLDAIKTGGVTKVNVATALSIAFIEGFIDAYKANPSEKDFRKFGSAARDRVKEKVKEYMRLFAGKID